MVKVTQQNFIVNKFSNSNTKTIIKALELVNLHSTPKQFIEQIPEQYCEEFCWIVAHKPAYHVQYQIDSVAILKISDICLIVWKPKFIEYPSMIQFPELKEKKIASLKLQVDKDFTRLSDSRVQQFIEYLQKFYGTFFHSDEDFQTNLVTFSKHFISKRSAISYWHCVYDDTQCLAVKNFESLQSTVKIRVSGLKQGYDKTLFLFSKKGERQGVFSSLTKKWTQTLSFLAMVLIFVSIVSCDSDQTEGICRYRSQAMVGGAGVMMSLFGMKIAQRAKNKSGLEKLKKN